MPKDGGAADLLRAPFEPGEAPFRVKGNAYRGHMQFVADEIPGGHAAQRAALMKLDPRRGPVWADFLEQRFLTSGWYDTYPLAVAGIACARIVGLPFLEFVFHRTCRQAKADISGIHKFLLKFISARAIAVRVPLVASQYFDFVHVTSDVPNPRLVRGELMGIPVDLAPWWATLAEAYVGTSIEIAGKLLPELRTEKFVRTGEAHGVELCTVHTIVTLKR